MGGSRKQAELKLLASVDQATLERSIAAFRKLQQEEHNLSAATTSRIQASRAGLQALVTNLKSESIISGEAARAANTHAKSLDGVRTAAQKATKELNFYQQAVRDRYGSQSTFLKGSAASGGVPSSGGSGGRASTGLAAVASVLPSGGASDVVRTASELARLSEVLPALGVSSAAAGAGVTGLVATLGPIALAVGAVTVAFALMKSALDEGRDAAAAFVGAIENTDEIKTSEEAQNRLNELRDQETNTLKNLDRLQEGRLNRLKEIENASHGGALDAIIADLFNTNGIGELEAAIEGYNATSAQGKIETELLTEDLKNGTFAANDAAAAQKKLKEETERAAEAAARAAEAQREAIAGAVIEGQLKYFEIIRTGTEESISKALEEAQIQKQIAEQQLTYLRAQLATASGDEADAINAKINQLEQALARSSSEVDAYSHALRSNAVQARSAAAAAEEQRRKSEEAIAAQKKALDELYANITERTQDAAQSIVDAERDLAEERLRIHRDFAQQIEDEQRQQRRDEAREQRRANFERMIALKQRELDEFDMLLRGDFAGVSRSRRQSQVEDEIDRARSEFEANEQIIAQQERDFDRELSRQRQLDALRDRAASARADQLNGEINDIRKLVEEWFRLNGIMANVAAASDAQIRRWFEWISQLAGAPRTTFGAPLGGSSAPAASGAPSTAFGPAFGGRSPAFGASGASGGGFTPTGGFTPSGSTVNATFNITGTDPRAIARAVDERLRRVVG